MNIESNPESSRTEWAVTATIGAPARIRDLDSAIQYLTGLLDFPAMDAGLRADTESLVAAVEAGRYSPPLAYALLDKVSEAYLGLVTDLTSWDCYRILLFEVFYPASYRALFGHPEYRPSGRTATELGTTITRESPVLGTEVFGRVGRSHRPGSANSSHNSRAQR
jgi:hypothetical protein